MTVERRDPVTGGGHVGAVEVDLRAVEFAEKLARLRLHLLLLAADVRDGVVDDLHRG